VNEQVNISSKYKINLKSCHLIEFALLVWEWVPFLFVFSIVLLVCQEGLFSLKLNCALTMNQQSSFLLWNGNNKYIQ